MEGQSATQEQVYELAEKYGTKNWIELGEELVKLGYRKYDKRVLNMMYKTHENKLNNVAKKPRKSKMFKRLTGRAVYEEVRRFGLKSWTATGLALQRKGYGVHRMPELKKAYNKYLLKTEYNQHADNYKSQRESIDSVPHNAEKKFNLPRLPGEQSSAIEVVKPTTHELPVSFVSVIINASYLSSDAKTLLMRDLIKANQ